jgi:hypothetical protein
MLSGVNFQRVMGTIGLTKVTSRRQTTTGPKRIDNSSAEKEPSCTIMSDSVRRMTYDYAHLGKRDDSKHRDYRQVRGGVCFLKYKLAYKLHAVAEPCKIESPL